MNKSQKLKLRDQLRRRGIDEEEIIYHPGGEGKIVNVYNMLKGKKLKINNRALSIIEHNVPDEIIERL